ncbi:uncharacterized protein TNCV_57551 [Trichonephila clavipes]|nr:uncharacterized protein TNCV_57551 [Trichonephila clavipes]
MPRRVTIDGTCLTEETDALEDGGRMASRNNGVVVDKVSRSSWKEFSSTLLKRYSFPYYILPIAGSSNKHFSFKAVGVNVQSCDKTVNWQVIYSQFGLAIHQNDHQARRRFVEWAQNEIAVVPDFHKRILFSDEAHFWLNGYVNKQNCRIWSEANPQVCVETPLHPEKLTVWCALWAGGILLQKR